MKNIWNVKDKKYNQTIINYNNIKASDKTLMVLWYFIYWEINKTDFPIYSNFEKTKIEIIIWKDYKRIIDTLEK